MGRTFPQYALLCDTRRRLGWVAFAPVRDALAGARTERRRTFAGVFSDLGESALPDFIDALQDPWREIRLGAIWGIARLREAGRPRFAGMLGGADQRIDKAATHALISMGPAVVPMLQEIRAAGPGRARRAALYCLAKIGGEEALVPADEHADAPHPFHLLRKCCQRPSHRAAKRLNTVIWTLTSRSVGPMAGSGSSPTWDGIRRLSLGDERGLHR
jgi:hypothetical protein